MLNIPSAVTPATVSVDQLAEAAGVKTDSTAVGTQGGAPTVSVNDLAAAAGVPEHGTELSVAVVLPFMLNEETPSKSAQRYTEFYKGFLLAADSLRNNGTPVRISVFDTEGSTAKVHDIIANPELKNHRLIIAPDNLEQFAMLGEFGRVNGIKVLNDFIVRDETYRTNPAVMQGNIPSAIMFEKAADVMVARMAYTVPVFLNLTDGANDKTEFIDAVKKRLDGKGTQYKTITVEGKLTKANLKELPAEGNYTFILNTGRQSDVNRLLPGLIEWRDEAVMPSIKVVGYPNGLRSEARLSQTCTTSILLSIRASLTMRTALVRAVLKVSSSNGMAPGWKMLFRVRASSDSTIRYVCAELSEKCRASL